MDLLRYLTNGYQHIAFSRVESTNTTALEYYDKTGFDKLWITAERQTKGRGSRGRLWESEEGNLYASLLLQKNMVPDRLATLTFVASLALYETLACFVSRDRLFLKWPNDILLNGAKISGILLESHVRSSQDIGVVIGIGVNCQHSPNDPGYIATSLQDSGVLIEPLVLFDYLVMEIDNWLGVWDNGTGFEIIRRAWLDRAMGIGCGMIAGIKDKKIRGVFEDIDQNGLLVLRTSDNLRQTVSVADIFFITNQENT